MASTQKAFDASSRTMKTLQLMTALTLLLATVTACRKSPTQSHSPSETQTAASTGVAEAPTVAHAEAPTAIASAANLGTDALCTRLCAATRPLKCKGAPECEQHCQHLVSLPACSREMVQTLKCFANQPSVNWECDTDGMPTIKAGHCDAEQAKFAACLQARQ